MWPWNSIMWWKCKIDSATVVDGFCHWWSPAVLHENTRFCGWRLVWPSFVAFDFPYHQLQYFGNQAMEVVACFVMEQLVAMVHLLLIVSFPESGCMRMVVPCLLMNRGTSSQNLIKLCEWQATWLISLMDRYVQFWVIAVPPYIIQLHIWNNGASEWWCRQQ